MKQLLWKLALVLGLRQRTAADVKMRYYTNPDGRIVGYPVR